MEKTLYEQALELVERHGMLRRGDRVVIALSGGADSMALAAFLLSIRTAYQLDLCAAHVNHMLRGSAADEDEAFVRAACQHWGVALHVHRADVRALAQQSGESVETCGRRVRYEFFHAFGPDYKVATAHTLSDSIETTLFHLARGTGLRGICGIPPVRGRYIRPLLTCTRAQVEAYCASQRIAFVTDGTNFDRCHTRNTIRLDIVPRLSAVNPSFDAAMRRFQAHMREDEAYLTALAQRGEEAARQKDCWSCAALLALDKPIRRRALSRILMACGGVMPEEKHIAAAEHLLRAGGRASLNGGVDMEVRGGLLRRVQPELPVQDFCLPVTQGEKTLPFATVRITCGEWGKNQDDKKNTQELLANSFDCDKINGKAVIRNRRAGDRFAPKGRGCTKQLRRLMQEAGVPPGQRDKRVIISDDVGILWVEGFGAAERAAITSRTSRVMTVAIWRNSHAQ